MLVATQPNEPSGVARLGNVREGHSMLRNCQLLRKELIGAWTPGNLPVNKYGFETVEDFTHPNSLKSAFARDWPTSLAQLLLRGCVNSTPPRTPSLMRVSIKEVQHNVLDLGMGDWLQHGEIVVNFHGPKLKAGGLAHSRPPWRRGPPW